MDLGVKQVFPESRVVCYCEIEKSVQKVLLKRMRGGEIDEAPIWPNIFNLRGQWFIEAGIEIDLITAGFPCQPFSMAGKRKGKEDERYLFPEIIRTACELGFPALFLENVPGITSIDDGRTFGQILGTLAEVGYDIRWGHVSAVHAGAPHKRERVFMYATNSPGIRQREIQVYDSPTFKNCWVSREYDCPPNKIDWWISHGLALREDDGFSRRLDKLFLARIKMLGNSVCPQQAALALRSLLNG